MRPSRTIIGDHPGGDGETNGLITADGDSSSSSSRHQEEGAGVLRAFSVRT